MTRSNEVELTKFKDNMENEFEMSNLGFDILLRNGNYEHKACSFIAFEEIWRRYSK